MTPDVKLLDINNVAIGIKRRKRETLVIVREANFDVNYGEMVGIVGESGSGKSQTAFSILGLLPSNAISTYGLTETGGGVVYDGVTLNGVAMQLIAGRILLQSPTMARTYRHTALPLQDGWLDTGDVGVMVDGRLREADPVRPGAFR